MGNEHCCYVDVCMLPNQDSQGPVWKYTRTNTVKTHQDSKSVCHLFKTAQLRESRNPIPCCRWDFCKCNVCLRLRRLLESWAHSPPEHSHKDSESTCYGPHREASSRPKCPPGQLCKARTRVHSRLFVLVQVVQSVKYSPELVLTLSLISNMKSTEAMYLE